MPTGAFPPLAQNPWSVCDAKAYHREGGFARGVTWKGTTFAQRSLLQSRLSTVNFSLLSFPAYYDAAKRNRMDI
ncbi:hypothetical protein IAS59_002108 [Cryptococcus gattii]